MREKLDEFHELFHDEPFAGTFIILAVALVAIVLSFIIVTIVWTYPVMAIPVTAVAIVVWRVHRWLRSER